MSRFLTAIFVGAAMAAAVSTSASAYHCLARSPNGATGTAFGIIFERAQSISLRRAYIAAVGLVAKSNGAGLIRTRSPASVWSERSHLA